MSRYLLFLHGFEGSSTSYKGQCIRRYLAAHDPDIQLLLPQLACYPQPMWLQIQEILNSFSGQLIGIVGASLGGLLAARTAIESHLPAVLINPLSDLDGLSGWLGERVHPFTAERYRLQPTHLQQLAELMISPQESSHRHWLMLQTGDEVLDFRQALQAHPQARRTIECGGEHGFSGFHRYVPAMIRFLLDNKE
ncbi:YqiA/YcfP family alpha/beta fold hydrolase [Celerinatantimonas sp. YJH-8]|uniref:YqiA/YcfP family alpha/beta fold hydrolase n=1 Tax=Celerinatantimonas sp. YJH-8 TaxID=3228714 RepID=UPI0038C1BF6F